MSAEVRSVVPRVALSDLERELLEEGVGGFPVVESGRLVGMVSRSDVVRQLSVEQSVGELLADTYRDLGSEEEADSSAGEAIARHVGRRMETLRVEDVMSRDVVSVAPDAPVERVAAVLASHRIHRVPVVDEKDQLVGVISTADFVLLVAEGKAGLRSA